MNSIIKTRRNICKKRAKKTYNFIKKMGLHKKAGKTLKETKKQMNNTINQCMKHKVENNHFRK